MSTLLLSRLFVRCNLMQQPYQRVQVSSLWLAQVSHVVAWFCKTLLAMRCRSYLLSDSTKHWKVTQIRQIFDCCTPDSQANLSRHQVYNNQKDSLTWVIFHCLDSTHIRSACVLFAYILRNWTHLGQTECLIIKLRYETCVIFVSDPARGQEKLRCKPFCIWNLGSPLLFITKHHIWPTDIWISSEILSRNGVSNTYFCVDNGEPDKWPW